ncbi:hypothetical protein BX600DRAFT_499944 [Xylariales sp. PMI_506]|nr:hypothetical protein BX600DRAFT_499944 [Xylariales sp. PMI_506]
MPPFSLSIHSFTPPTLPAQPTDVPDFTFRSPHISTIAAATSPLCFTISLPFARDKNPLYPATHLQLSYFHDGTGEIFPSKAITSQDLVKSEGEGEEHLYIVQVPPQEVPRTKVNEGRTSAADVNVYAWRGEKMLGKWNVGRIEDLGFVGLKSHPDALLFQKAWEAKQEAWEAKNGRG